MKKLFFQDKPITGLDIGQTGAKIMAIDTKSWCILGYGGRDMEPAMIRESIESGNDYLANQLKELVNSHLHGRLPSNHVVVSAPTGRTYSRTITLPASAEKNLSEAVQLEAEQYIPVAVSELNIDYEVVERSGDTVTALMSAVPKKLVDALVTSCDKAGLRVVMVEPGLNAISHLVAATEQGHLPTVIIDIGAVNTNIAMFDSTIRVTGAVPIGGNHFTLEIAKSMHILLDEAHTYKVKDGLQPGPKQDTIREALAPPLNKIIAEINKVVRYYAERLGNKKKIEQVVIVGGGSNVPGLGDFFTNELTMASRVANPWQMIRFAGLPEPTDQFRPRFITAAGLAMVNPQEIWR
jgi:type IV pilus assembly protein PilM